MFYKLSCDRSDQKMRLFIKQTRFISWWSMYKKNIEECLALLASQVSDAPRRAVMSPHHIPSHRCWFACSRLPTAVDTFHLYWHRQSGTGRSSDAPFPSSQSPRESATLHEQHINANDETSNSRTQIYWNLIAFKSLFFQTSTAWRDRERTWVQ